MKLHLAQIGRAESAHCYVRAVAGPPPGSSEFRRRMNAVGDALRARRVAAIFLVQSSFAAWDARYLLLELARRWPAGSSLLRQAADQIVDGCLHEAGDYTPRYVEILERALAGQGDETPVRLVHWSGENHHLGRADAAVRLIEELAALELPPDKRVMIWGHGQAGNVLALASGLLSGDKEAIAAFFAAAQIYYRLPVAGVIDIPLWQRVRQMLCNRRQPLARRSLDLVTFGTPCRYVWTQRSDDTLLHFINHRPATDTGKHLAPPPPSIDELHQAAAGDYLQQFAVAGADTPPSPLAWRSWLANRRLARFLEADADRTRIADRLAAGVRAPDAGTTLLVDYGPAAGPLSQHLAGHAVYTRREWLLFHAEQVVEQLGGQASTAARAA
ncbi:MAG TPA: hypothetical protein VJ783_01915 [Pirellulales bacterium]|nr:hypothetical protein [Pirellulales bacterium]